MKGWGQGGANQETHGGSEEGQAKRGVHLLEKLRECFKKELGLKAWVGVGFQ